MKKKLIIVCAPPASGKTYVSKRLAEVLPSPVYLDKDDLAPIMKSAFRAAGEEFNMDSAFYSEKLRDAEYETVIGIALSTLAYSDTVILNAPFSREVRDGEYMKALRARAEGVGAELLLVWVTAPIEVIRERMAARGAVRDIGKLRDFESYASRINYSAPSELIECGAVGELFIFDSATPESTERSLEELLTVIRKEKPED